MNISESTVDLINDKVISIRRANHAGFLRVGLPLNAILINTYDVYSLDWTCS